jgi:hypothetical protein
MHVVIMIESITIVSSIRAFQHELIPMLFHMDSIRKFKSFIHNCRFITTVVIIIGVKQIEDNKSEKQLLITNREGEFDQDILLVVTISKHNMNNFLRHTMEVNVLWF